MASERPVALVTGGAKRIGAAITRDLTAQGFTVAIHCNRSQEAADTLAAEINAAGGHAAVFVADLADARQARQMLTAAGDQLGPVQLLVNNASVFDDDSVRHFDELKWDLHFSVHVKAPSVLAGAMADQLAVADKEGLVVNIIDQRVWALTPRFYSYTLSKSALWTATRTMAQALGPRIRVNALAPGPTLPNERQRPEDFRRQVNALLLKRGPALEEFGAALRFLWQARSVTGQMIALDGGQHLAWQTPDVTGVRE